MHWTASSSPSAHASIEEKWWACCETGDDTSQRVARELSLDDSPRDFGQEHAKLSDTAGKERNVRTLTVCET